MNKKTPGKKVHKTWCTLLLTQKFVRFWEGNKFLILTNYQKQNNRPNLKKRLAFNPKPNAF
jgi:hypothetical protein